MEINIIATISFIIFLLLGIFSLLSALYYKLVGPIFIAICFIGMSLLVPIKSQTVPALHTESHNFSDRTIIICNNIQKEYYDINIYNNITDYVCYIENDYNVINMFVGSTIKLKYEKK